MDSAALQVAFPAVPRGAPSSELLFPKHNFAVFIVFSWNFELFWVSLQTYMAAGWGKRVIIIDNSPGKLALNDPGMGSQGSIVLRMSEVSSTEALAEMQINAIVEAFALI